MNTPSEWAKKEAEGLLDKLESVGHLTTYKWSESVTKVALALDSARRAPEGHIIDDKGEVRKVLGTLPTLASGEIINMDAEIEDLYLPHPNGRSAVSLTFDYVRGHDWAGIGAFYSTREAAEKAREQR